MKSGQHLQTIQGERVSGKDLPKRQAPKLCPTGLCARKDENLPAESVDSLKGELCFQDVALTTVLAGSLVTDRER